MMCVLCGSEITLLDLDDEGWNGEPCHKWCGDAARDAVAMISAEKRGGMHRTRRAPWRSVA